MDANKFIERACKVHGNKYDYSKVEYVNNNVKVCIICPEHGEFLQTPHNHLRGQKCPKCSGCIVYTTEKWIEAARKVHGDKYDYSKVEYINAKTKVCIICPEHGEFWQKPNNHLMGKGCIKCSGNLKNTEDWINQAYSIHKGKYDYSKTKYINAKTKLCITCPKHGEFWQLPNDHLISKGCPMCANERVIELNSYDTNSFIEKACEIHNHKYDYSKVKYNRSNQKVCIICP